MKELKFSELRPGDTFVVIRDSRPYMSVPSFYSGTWTKIKPSRVTFGKRMEFLDINCVKGEKQYYPDTMQGWDDFSAVWMMSDIIVEKVEK